MELAAIGVGALGVSGLGFLTGVALGLREFRRWLLGWRWERAWVEHEAELIEQATVENGLVDALAVVARKVHYRHNIHCPQCGRFARQAEGLPAGVADCGVHGLGTHTPPATGAIPVVLVELPAAVGEIFPEPPGFEVSLTEAPFPLERAT